jgi:hypothetical protein
MSAAEKLYLEIGNNIPNAMQSQMFGKPCFKLNGKAFICFFQNEMVFKLDGAAHTNAMLLEGAQLFDPSGKKRPMKAWVQLPFQHASVWAIFAKNAAELIN